MTHWLGRRRLHPHDAVLIGVHFNILAGCPKIAKEYHPLTGSAQELTTDRTEK